jgi:hypothetical protein
MSDSGFDDSRPKTNKGITKEQVLGLNAGLFRFDQCPIPELRERQKAMAALFTEDDRFCCSGFFVNFDGGVRLVTAIHALIKYPRFKVSSIAGTVVVENPIGQLSEEDREAINKALREENNIHDFFFLEIPDELSSAVASYALDIDFDKAYIEPGQKYFILGHSGINKGEQGVVAFGRATNSVLPKSDRDVHVIQTYARGGMSGGLCVDEEYNPVGVVKGMLVDHMGVLVETLSKKPGIKQPGQN